MNVKPNKHEARSDATRATLLTAARPLFAAHGYSGVGTEAIVKAAGVTRGALYHQFRDKADLFEAVFEVVELEITEAIAATVLGSGAASAIDGLIAGAEAWLDACGDPAVQRIILIDAPSVLGWERWREIGVRYGLGLTEAALQGAMDAGEVESQPLHPLAHVLIGALDEAALYIARSEDPVAARAEVGAVLTRLVQSLRVNS
jgi:AcrR family transcriptional regulator